MSPSLTPAESARLVLERLEAGERAVSAVVTQSPSAPVGARCLFSGGRVHGTLGSTGLDAAAEATAQVAFDVAQFAGVKEAEVEYEQTFAVVCFELHAPSPSMVIVGAGHIAQPLSKLGSMLGFRVAVLDDRPDFASRERFPDADAVRVIDFRDPFAQTPLVPSTHVVLVTRGHRFDYECLIRILGMESPPSYIGMIGSRRRVRATHEQLVNDGFSLAQIQSVRAPVGLDLGGQTPAEIAVSVAAEIVQLRSGGQGVPLSEKERIVERFFTEGQDG